MVFGPMIDLPPAHPDTVIIAVLYLERIINAFRTRYYRTPKSQSTTNCIILHDKCNGTTLSAGPASYFTQACTMHTLMSFGCTKTGMKASGVVVLMSAAFGGSANIINGKAWTETLRAYCLIIDVLLRGSTKAAPRYSRS